VYIKKHFLILHRLNKFKKNPVKSQKRIQQRRADRIDSSSQRLNKLPEQFQKISGDQEEAAF
jgi:hypothetical protein